MPLSNARQFLERYSLGTILLCVIGSFYLLIPTSAPLVLDGLPLDHKTEFLVFITLVFTILFAFVLRYLSAIGLVSFKYRKGRAARLVRYLEIAALVLFLTLIFVKFFFPTSRKLTSCFEIPGVQNDQCVWLPEGRKFFQIDKVSRVEDSISFGSADRPWRLASFNDARVFDVYNQPEGTFRRKIQDLRKHHTYPFAATFDLGLPVAELLQQDYSRNDKIMLAVKYTGGVEISDPTNAAPVVFPFTETEQTKLFEVPVSSVRNLMIRYRNFRCVDEKRDPSQCAPTLEVTSLHIESARLNVGVVDPRDGKNVSVGYATLFAHGRRRTTFLAFAFLEILAIVFAGLTVLVRLYRHLAPIRKNLIDFGRQARQHLPAVAQVIVVGVMAALAISTFYRHLFQADVLSPSVRLTILLPAGAVYISLFWMLLFSARVKQFFNSAFVPLGSSAAIIAIAPFLIYLGFTLLLRVAPMNDVSFLNPGDDPFIYASDAMGILETGAPRTSGLAFTHYATKPLFLHFKALYYAAFGGGEAYYSILMTIAFACVWSALLAFLVLSQSSINQPRASTGWPLRIAIAAGCAIAYVSLGRTVLAYGARFAGMAFSEGPAWLLALGIFGLLVTLSVSKWPQMTMWLMGACFAAVLCFRTQYVMFLPAVVCLCAFIRKDLTWKKILLSLCLPTLALGGFFLLYYLRDPPTAAQSQRFFFVATPFWTAFSRALLLNQAKLLFPSYWEFLSAVTVLALLAWYWLSRGTTARLIFLIATYAATVFVIDGIVAGHSGYHPRHIILTFFLSGCAILVLIQNRFRTE